MLFCTPHFFEFWARGHCPSTDASQPVTTYVTAAPVWVLVLCSTLQVNALALDYCLYILILCLISYIDGSMIIAVIGYCIVLIYFINFLHVVSRGSCGESVGFSSSAFVPVNHTFVPVNHTRVSHCFSPQLGTPSFLCSSPVFFPTAWYTVLPVQ